MRNLKYPLLGMAVAATLSGCASWHGQPLHQAYRALDVGKVKTVEFAGTGRWYQFGQAPAPGLSWPPFDASVYKAAIDYANAGAHVQIVRKQVVEPGRNRPAPTEQKPDQYIVGATAWNLAPPPNTPPGTAAVPQLQPLAVEERAAEIVATPQGFLKAAHENAATRQIADGGREVSFVVGGKYRYVGHFNAQNELESVKTWIDNPVLGDTLIETRFGDYRDFGGVRFPARIVREQGGFPVLDLNVSSVSLNSPVEIGIPPELAGAKPPAIVVKADKLAEGVYYLTGGTHHSVAIEQNDHVVLVEAPLHEERSLALIEKIGEIIPGKPIKYVVNSHAHFDHSGGLRTFVDAGATIVAELANKDYYEKIWANPHSLNPDRLEKSRKTPTFEAYTGKHTLSDGRRSIEIYSIAGNSHNDAFDLVYLPKEKILIEADAYTPLPPNAPPPASVNPYSVNLYENIRRLKLDVAQIAGLHGPKAVTLNDLRKYIGVAATDDAPVKAGKKRPAKAKAGA